MFHLPFVLFMALSLITHCDSTPTSCKSSEKSLKHKNSWLKCSATGELQRWWGGTHCTFLKKKKKNEASDSFWRNTLWKMRTFMSRSERKGQSRFWNPFATFKIMSTFFHLDCTWYLTPACLSPAWFDAQTWTASNGAGDLWQTKGFSSPSD